MKVFDLVIHSFDALKSGRSLNNVAAWKNVQVVGSLIAALLGICASLGWNFGLTNEQVYGLATGVAALVNGYLTIATSKKVGIGNGNSQGGNDQSALPAIELQSTKPVFQLGEPTTSYRDADAPTSTFNGIPESDSYEEADATVQSRCDSAKTLCETTNGFVGTSESGWNG